MADERVELLHPDAHDAQPALNVRQVEAIVHRAVHLLGVHDDLRDPLAQRRQLPQRRRRGVEGSVRGEKQIVGEAPDLFGAVLPRGSDQRLRLLLSCQERVACGGLCDERALGWHAENSARLVHHRSHRAFEPEMFFEIGDHDAQIVRAHLRHELQLGLIDPGLEERDFASRCPRAGQ